MIPCIIKKITVDTTGNNNAVTEIWVNARAVRDTFSFLFTFCFVNLVPIIPIAKIMLGKNAVNIKFKTLYAISKELIEEMESP